MKSATMNKAVVLYLQIDFHPILLRMHSIEHEIKQIKMKTIIERTINLSHIRHYLAEIYRHNLPTLSLENVPWHSSCSTSIRWINMRHVLSSFLFVASLSLSEVWQLLIGIFVLVTTKKEIVIKDSAYNLQHLKYVTFKLKSNCIVVS